MSEPRKHSKFAASSSDRWLRCLGSPGLCEKAPPSKSSSYADAGTDAHFCLEQFLKNPKKRLQTGSDLREKYPLQMVMDAEKAADEITKRIPKGAEFLCETRVSLSFIDPEMFGTVDAAIIEHFGRLTIIDFKYGFNPVEPEENSQLIYYALGLAHLYDYNFEEIAIAIYQPRAEHPNGFYREWIIPIDVLHEWADKFSLAVSLSKSKNAPLNPGYWCKYCPAASICPELSQKALAKAQVVFDETSGDVCLPIPDKVGVPPEQLSKMLNAFELIEVWIEKVREYAFEVAQVKEIEGWKVVEKRSIRKWTNPEQVEKEGHFEFGPKIFTPLELLSPAQFEKAIPEAKEWVAKRVSNISSGTTLVRATDSRKAVKCLDVFSEITPQGDNQSKNDKKEKHGKTKN